MRSLKNSWLLLAVTLLSCASSGCSGISLGPQVKTEYVIVHAGRPLQVLENAKVKGRVLDGSGDAVEQDIGGWTAMPTDHWEAVKRQLESPRSGVSTSAASDLPDCQCHNFEACGTAWTCIDCGRRWSDQGVNAAGAHVLRADSGD